MSIHGRGCDCDDCFDTRKAKSVRWCLNGECCANLAAEGRDYCLMCDPERCTWCGLVDECTVPTSGPAEGDRVCVHCASGHQRVLHFREGAAAVHGPCACEVA
jgi:hypothetical protein